MKWLNGLVLLLILSIVVGCSKTEDQNHADNGSATTVPSTTVSSTESPSVEQKELRTYTAYMAGVNPMGSNKNIMNEYLNEKFKINIEATWPSGEDAGTKINLMTATGEVPDVVRFWDLTLMHSLADAGLLLPLDDMIDKMPNYKKYVNKGILDYARNPSDGKLYVITNRPITPENTEKLLGDPPSLLMSRSDIKAAVGLPDPKTPDELYNYLKAVKELGMKDLIPLGMTKWDLDGALSLMFGFPPYRVQVDDTKQEMIEQPFLPHYVDYLKYAAKLYREKLLDPEIFSLETTLDKAKEGRYAMLFSGNGPIIQWVHPALSQKGIDGKYDPIVFPRAEGVDKINLWNYSPFGDAFVGISKKAQQPERLIEFIDWMFTNEGNTVMWWGAPKKGENWWYQDENGKPVWDQDFYNQMNEGKVQNNSGYWSYNMAFPGVNSDVHLMEKYAAGGLDPFILKTREVGSELVYTDEKMQKYLGKEKGPIYKEKYQAYNNLLQKWTADIIIRAKTDTEVEQKYSQMISEMEKAGIHEIAAENYKLYQEANK